MIKKRRLHNLINAVLVLTAASVLVIAGSFNAFAEGTDNPGEVVQIVPAESGEVGPAFDPKLNGDSSQSGDTGSGTGNASSAVDPSRPMVALTFDDGPHSENTPRLLSYLKMYNAKATFFVVGNRVKGREAILQQMIADGCEIGNHTYGHENLHKTNHAKTIQTINSTNDIIQAACGVRPTLLRPPGGAVDKVTLGTIGSLGMSSIMWSIDTKDWKTRNVQSNINSVLNNVQDGDIILMHDIHSTTVDSCGIIIPELINRGYQLVTVSELAAARGGLAPGGQYFKFRP